ncbi:MAG: alpha/beta fold hydrolase [Lapillicoccus sp.]
MTDVPLRDHVAGLAVRRDGCGPDAATLVLLHGNGDSADCWPDAVSRWSATHHLVAADARGHGSSPRFNPDQLVEPGDVFVADTVALLEAVRRPGVPLAAIGHSLGGASLTAACAEHPGLVDALVLIDPPWDIPVIRGPRLDVGAERVLLVTAYASDPQGELVLLRGREPGWPESERRAWMAAKAELDLAYVALGAGRPSTPWTEHAPRLSAPTLVVTGSDDVLVGHASRAVIGALGNSLVEVAVIPGAGHYARQDDPDAFHAIVDPWLAARLQ